MTNGLTLLLCLPPICNSARYYDGHYVPRSADIQADLCVCHVPEESQEEVRLHPHNATLFNTRDSLERMTTFIVKALMKGPRRHLVSTPAASPLAKFFGRKRSR